MSEFVLEVHGHGRTITVEAVGTIDEVGARAMLDALDTLRADLAHPLLSLRLDRVTGCTAPARQLLASHAIVVDGEVSREVVLSAR